MIRKLLFVVVLLALALIAFRAADIGFETASDTTPPTSANDRNQRPGPDSLPNKQPATNAAKRPESQVALASYHAEVAGAEVAGADGDVTLDVPASLLRSARSLELGQSIKASLRYKIALFGQEISGPGFFVQEGQGSGRWRMELQHSSPQSRLRLAQVCDGRIFYRLEELDDRPELSFVDLNKLPSGNGGPDDGLAWRNPWADVGGLPSSLKHMAAHFEFDSVKRDKLGELDVYKVVGRWKPAALLKMFSLAPSGSQENTDDGSASDRPPISQRELLKILPAHMPHVVQLVLGTDQDRFPLFPYRMVFYRYEFIGDTPEPELKPIVIMEFFNLERVSRISSTLFQVASPIDGSTDLTEAYIEQAKRMYRLR